MPYAELMGWREYYGVEPWGLDVKDALQANAVAVLANINRNTEKRSEPYRLKDFLLFAPKEKPRIEPTVEGKTAAQWRLIFAADASHAARARPQ